MGDSIRALAVIGLLYAAWEYWRQQQEVDAEAGAVTVAPPSILDDIEGALGFMNLGAMKRVRGDMLNDGNVRAFLRVIRTGEGTADADGYRRMFGGELFSGFADHPRRKITRKLGGRNITSTAAGAYQFLSSTWDETRARMGLTDFAPASQDLAALGRIAARGALNDVLAGRFASAVRKCAYEWASLPGSPYGQPVMTAARASAVYAAAGGVNTQA